MIAHDTIEKNLGLMLLLVVFAISIGGMVQILPLFFMHSTTEPVEGLKPYSGLQLAGRDVYIREGCYVCHSQMIRPFRAETERYGHYSMAGEFIYDRPFQWGSKRTGPDLQRVGGRYSDDWHRAHLMNPRDVVPESIMPGYPWLAQNKVDKELTLKKMHILKNVFGHPYTDQDFKVADDELDDKTEMDALIAYLQCLGTAVKTTR